MTHWLSDDQQRSWRSWLTMNKLLSDVLDRELKAAVGFGLPEYEILVHLSEAPGQGVRMADLAHRTLTSRSRLTHQIDRMERAGWVVRKRCEEDQRGQWAVMTPAGLEVIQRAAPTHVSGVRAHLVDVLGEEFSSFGRMCATVAEPLTEATPGVSPPLTREDA
jgi:DNA-binding MarR family transcriptional regulator